MPQPQTIQGNTTLAQPTATDIKDATKQVDPLPTQNINPLKEYVAGGNLSYLQDYYRALPQYIDDITSDFGPDIYERMLKDSQVTSAFESLRMGVLASGVNFPGRVQDEKDPDFAQSEEVRQFVERNLTQRLNQPFRQICYDLLEGMAHGHKVAELVYEYAAPVGGGAAQDEDKGKICLKAIKVKPQRVTAFVVDAYYNVVALVGLLPGQGVNAIVTQGIIGVPSSAGISAKDTPANLLPREKFAVFTYRPQDADPRGTSILRPAYSPWWEKQQYKAGYLAYMAQFASPSLIGYTPEDSVSFPVSDSYANPTPDATTGEQKYLTPEQTMGTALASFRNGTYLVLPGGSKVEPLQMNGNGEAFTNAFEFCNSEITKAIQYQTLSTNEGQHQSRAASQTHENVKDMVINFAKEALADCINWDIIYNLVRYNYGEDVARRLAPQVDFSDGAAQDFATDGTAIAALQTAGYLHVSQYQGIDSKLGLPPRDLEQQLADMEADKQAQADQQQQTLDIARAKANTPPQPQPSQKPQPTQDKAKMSADFDHWVTIDHEHVLIGGEAGDKGTSKKEGGKAAPEKKTESSKPGELQAHEVRAKLEEMAAQHEQKRKELEAASREATERFSNLAWAVYEYEDGTPEQAAKQKEADQAGVESDAKSKQHIDHILSRQAQLVSVLHVANPAKLEPKFKLNFEGEVQRQGRELESKFDEHYNNLQDVHDSLMKKGESGEANDIAEKMNTLYNRHQEEMYQLRQKVQGEFSGQITAKWQKGIDAFSNLVGTGTVDGKPLNVKDLDSNDRSFFSSRNTAINLTPHSETKTVVHELGHWLEHHDPEVKRKVNEFLDRRTKGEEPQKLSDLTGLHGYDGTEYAKADQFINPYMGKLYPDKSTEITAMGLEHMVSDPLEFARKDPDYFDFIYNTVRGK